MLRLRIGAPPQHAIAPTHAPTTSGSNVRVMPTPPLPGDCGCMDQKAAKMSPSHASRQSSWSSTSTSPPPPPPPPLPPRRRRCETRCVVPRRTVPSPPNRLMAPGPVSPRVLSTTSNCAPVRADHAVTSRPSGSPLRMASSRSAGSKSRYTELLMSATSGLLGRSAHSSLCSAALSVAGVKVSPPPEHSWRRPWSSTYTLKPTVFAPSPTSCSFSSPSALSAPTTRSWRTSS